MIRERIQCPRCGASMNRHAEKVDYSATRDRMDPLEQELGGVISEFHTCPGCRFIVQRLVGGESGPRAAF
jgi:hypothetical protein